MIFEPLHFIPLTPPLINPTKIMIFKPTMYLTNSSFWFSPFISRIALFINFCFPNSYSLMKHQVFKGKICLCSSSLKATPIKSHQFVNCIISFCSFQLWPSNSAPPSAAMQLTRNVDVISIPARCMTLWLWKITL